MSNLITWPSNSLKEISIPIKRIDKVKLQELVQDMKEVMYKYKGIGLAAIQIGINKRIMVIDYEQITGPKNPIVIINPKLIKGEGEQVSEEGCLSVPGPGAIIKRFEKIEVQGLDHNLEPWERSFEGLPANIFQHEIDHLNGKFFFDHLSTLKKDMYVRHMKKQLKRGQSWRFQVQESL